MAYTLLVNTVFENKHDMEAFINKIQPFTQGIMFYDNIDTTDNMAKTQFLEGVKEGWITDNVLKSDETKTENVNELTTIQTREKILEQCKDRIDEMDKQITDPLLKRLKLN